MFSSEFDYKTEIIDGKEYFRICSSRDISEKKGRRFRFGNDYIEQVAVFRVKGNLYCLANVCPHRYVDKIFDGIIDDMKIICPAHGWTYHLESGNNVNPNQGVKNLKKFNVFELDGFVYLEKPEFDIPKWRRKDLTEFDNI